jgi:hypothetical protein
MVFLFHDLRVLRGPLSKHQFDDGNFYEYFQEIPLETIHNPFSIGLRLLKALLCIYGELNLGAQTHKG